MGLSLLEHPAQLGTDGLEAHAAGGGDRFGALALGDEDGEFCLSAG